MALNDDRLSQESLDEYFATGVPSQHLQCTDPEVVLTIDPAAERFTLRTPTDGSVPDLRELRHVSVDVENHEDGTTWSLVHIDTLDMRYEAYGVTMSVVDALRGGASFAGAVNAAVANLRNLLASRTRLSEEQQRGLLGELLLLERLLQEHGPAALEWWLGPAAEQHDFACPSYDLEVKTTSAEKRRHTISGVDQLKPNPGRPLWLVSIQVTRAGGAEGRTLAELVARVRSLAPGDDRLVAALHEVGWRDEDADLYTRGHLLRSTPRAYLVDDGFPAITSERIRSAVPHPELISDIVYRVDVSNRTPGDPGPELHSFLQIEGVER